MFLRRYQKTKDGKQHYLHAASRSAHRRRATPAIRRLSRELNHDQEKDAGNAPSSFTNRQGEAQQLRLFQRKIRSRSPMTRMSCHPPEFVGMDQPRTQLRRTSGWPDGCGTKLQHRTRSWPAPDRGQATVRPADTGHRRYQSLVRPPASEFELAEHWSASTALPSCWESTNEAVTKDALYRPLARL